MTNPFDAMPRPLRWVLPIDGPNQTDPSAKNGGVAVRCEIGGYVGGALGSLSGAGGGKAFDRTCVDRVTK